MITFLEAQQLIIQQAASFGKEKILLDEAVGRVLAETIVADRAYPPFNRATMDGYAVSLSALQEGVKKFKVAEIIYAGKQSSINIKKDECYKIMTGAAVPVVANIVIKKEDAIEENSEVKFNINDPKIFQFISKQGEDLQQDEVISKGSVKCTPALLGTLAAVGKHEVWVERLPKIAIVTTGDEVVAVNSNVNAVQIRNSNLQVLKALLNKWKIKPVACAHVADDKEALETVLTSQLNCDIIILSGAVSAGDADFVPFVLEKIGAKKIFHKTAIKPGKPIWFGKFDNGPVVFGLPGNPFSCIVTFNLFIEVFLSCSFNLGIPLLLSMPINVARKKNNTLDEFFPAKITGNPSTVEPIAFNSSGDITAAIDANIIAHHPAAINELSVGTVVNCYKLE